MIQAALLPGILYRIATVRCNLLIPHFAVQSGNGFNPDVELLRVCETFSFLEKDEQTLSSSKVLSSFSNLFSEFFKFALTERGPRTILCTDVHLE